MFRALLNVFRYITFRTGGAMVTGALFVFLFGPWIIDHLRLRQGKGQPIRSDGPASHIVTKKGTPTMGGLMILFGIIVSTVLWANPANRYVWIVLGVTISFGAVGFYDDYLKVTKQTHRGVSGLSRLAVEALIAAVACYAIVSLGREPFATSLTFPFFKELVLPLGWLFMVFGSLIIVGAGNYRFHRKANLAGKTVMGLLRDLEVVVIETDCAKGQCDAEHDPDVIVGPVDP